MRTDEGVRRVLGALAQQNVVTVYTGGVEPVYAIERGQHLVAAFYRNSAIHHFVDRAVAEVVMLSPPEDRWDEAMRLRDQLKFEFFFPDKAAYRAELSAELRRLDPGWETVSDGRTVLEGSEPLVADRVLRSFLDAHPGIVLDVTVVNVALQGLGAALLSPAALATVMTLFPGVGRGTRLVIP